MKWTINRSKRSRKSIPRTSWKRISETSNKKSSVLCIPQIRQYRMQVRSRMAWTAAPGCNRMRKRRSSTRVYTGNRRTRVRSVGVRRQINSNTKKIASSSSPSRRSPLPTQRCKTRTISTKVGTIFGSWRRKSPTTIPKFSSGPRRGPSSAHSISRN